MKKIPAIIGLFVLLIMTFAVFFGREAITRPQEIIPFDVDIVLAEDGFWSYYYVNAIHQIPVGSIATVPDEELNLWITCEDGLILSYVQEGTQVLIEMCPRHDVEIPQI